MHCVVLHCTVVFGSVEKCTVYSTVPPAGPVAGRGEVRAAAGEPLGHTIMCCNVFLYCTALHCNVLYSSSL